jgi:cell division septal protein FtsQ
MISFGSKKPKNDIPRRRRLDDLEISEQPRASTQYRRNQTLSGVQRTPIADSPRGQVHHLTIQRRKIGGLFVLVLGAAILLAILLTQLMAQVSVASSTKPLSSPFKGDAYEKSINNYLGLHPAERLRFALNQTALSEYVAAALPEVETVKVSGVKDVVDTQFAITFRQPVAGWQINGKQYYVDNSGVVFETNYYDSPSVQIVDESGISPSQGTTVASSRLLGFLGKVVAQAQGRGYTVTQAILPVGMTRELDIQLKDISTRIKLSTDRGAGEQVEDMSRALNYLNSKGQHPGYIDVRVSGRAAYQ